MIPPHKSPNGQDRGPLFIKESPCGSPKLSKPPIPETLTSPGGTAAPAPISVPPAAYESKYAEGWLRLTALARGYLVRRLVATDKVKFLKRTIKETITCAVKLHQEIGEHCVFH